MSRYNLVRKSSDASDLAEYVNEDSDTYDVSGPKVKNGRPLISLGLIGIKPTALFMQNKGNYSRGQQIRTTKRFYFVILAMGCPVASKLLTAQLGLTLD